MMMKEPLQCWQQVHQQNGSNSNMGEKMERQQDQQLEQVGTTDKKEKNANSHIATESEMAPLLSSCWRRTWHHCQSHPSLAAHIDAFWRYPNWDRYINVVFLLMAGSWCKMMQDIIKTSPDYHRIITGLASWVQRISVFFRCVMAGLPTWISWR